MQSKEMLRLMNQINSSGMEKLDGYSYDLLDSIPMSERKDAEDLIVKAFLAGDSPIAKLVAKLHFYDGKQILTDALNSCFIPSGRSVEIVFALSGNGLDEQLGIVLEKNYEEDESSRLAISERLMSLQPSYSLFKFCEKLFDFANSSVERTSLANCILYSCGIIKDPNNLAEIASLIKLNSDISTDDEGRRQSEIRKLENEHFSFSRMRRVGDINRVIISNILGGSKVPHSVSQPVIYSENGHYYLAVFVFFYTREDIEAGAVDRPSVWAIADIETGEFIKEYETKEKDFSDAPYDVKYNIRSDAQYDTSKEYYDKAFAILDSVREKLISSGKLYSLEYKAYLDRILANIPQDYQRFYRDLSV